MPRYTIVRAHDGSKAKKFEQGETNTNKTVQATSPVAPGNLEQLVWETAVGNKSLHQSKKATGLPTGCLGYIHSKGNKRLLSVTRLDTKKYTIEIHGEGQVNGGFHRF